MIKKTLVLAIILLFAGLSGQSLSAGVNLDSTCKFVGNTLLLDTTSSVEVGFMIPGQIASGFQLDLVSVPIVGVSDYVSLKNIWAGIITETEDFYAQTVFFHGLNRTYGDGSNFEEPFTDASLAFHYDPSMVDKTVISHKSMFSQQGTGLDQSITIRDSMMYGVSLYQDSRLGDGFYTADLLYAAVWGSVNFEANIGASFPVGNWGIYHGGIFVKFAAGDSADMLIKANIPLYEPNTALPGLSDLNIMIEPHADFGIFDLYLTLFFHPEMYNYAPMPDEGKIDISLGLGFFEDEDVIASGGLDLVTVLDLTGTEKVGVFAIPFVNFKSFEGSEIRLRWNAKLFPFSIADLISFTLTINTEYDQ
jgi:hypothetical protein